MLTMDPPDHTRLRRLVSSAFTPRAIAGLEPWIRDLTGRLLAPADAAAGFDLIDTLAFPLPIAVICHLLGIPAQDQARFRVWGHDVAATLDPELSSGAESQTRASELALTVYLRDLVAKRRADPDDSRTPRGTWRSRSACTTASAPLLVLRGYERVPVRAPHRRRPE
jgi:cytochrome P450